MGARVVTAQKDTIGEAATILKRGGLVAFPTETVYGLGADALNGRAVARIFEAKGRPEFNPVIVHVVDADAAAALVEMSDGAKALAAHFWPGPLTFILPRRKNCPVSELCSAGLPTLAVRAPDHPVAQALLKAAGVPVAAPSANASGSLSPTTPTHVAESLGYKVDLILAGGACAVGLESTVLDLSGDVPAVVRPGAISAEDITTVLGREVVYDAGNPDKPKSPGQLLRHYAPRAKLRLNAVDLEPGEALLAFGSDKFMGIRGGGAAKDLADEKRRNLSETGDLAEAAANLFRMLHELDRNNERIAVMSIPDNGLGIAINDRIKKAAAGIGGGKGAP
ncbi:MAG TPA: L-threonylcarbamoyladenylate synthase [Patescibacteria group bacterium]|nr:L-threonylcarbamoyladenylate synthase [Patescibacteria group bacterium]